MIKIKILNKKEKEVLDGLFTGSADNFDTIKKFELAKEVYILVKVENE